MYICNLIANIHTMIQRKITNYLQEMSTKFPVLSLTGPRQSGKTTLLKNAFPDYKYFNLERLDHRELVSSDPFGFLNSHGPKVIFDEAQVFPELFSYIQVVSDERGIPGQYILSGSQSFLLNEKISQSLAGRVSVCNLLPFDIQEIQALAPKNIHQLLLNGFYPRLYDAQISPEDFYPSYLQTYIERDIRSLKSVENLATFSKFLSLCAGRVGQVLNLSSLANDTGISVNTVKSWLSLLESSYIIYLLQPYHRNFNKRLIKSPKLYFYDTGILCSLLKLNSYNDVFQHYMYGSLFENFIISEITKSFYHNGKQPKLYYWRESNGVEIDCIIEKSFNEIIALELKAGQSFTKDFLRNLKLLPKDSINFSKILVYGGEENSTIGDTKIVSVNQLSSFLNLVHNS